jgi:hypothetical protein
MSDVTGGMMNRWKSVGFLSFSISGRGMTVPVEFFSCTLLTISVSGKFEGRSIFNHVTSISINAIQGDSKL